MQVKLIKAVVLLNLAIVAYHFIGPYDYDCFRCGARKNWYFIHETDESSIVRNIRGRDCDHEWILNSSMMGCADCFARRKIPLTHFGTVQGLDLLPSDIWKKDLLSALTDRKNKLKWTIPIVLNGIMFDLTNRDTEAKWKQWRIDFAPMFTAEYDLQTARVKARALSENLISVFNNHGVSQTSSLLADLELEKNDNKIFHRTVDPAGSTSSEK